MNVSDPVADMMTRIRNAVAAKHDFVLVPASKLKMAVAKVMREEGFIKDFEILRDNPQETIKIHLVYQDHRQPVINGLKRVSKPGLRVYVQRREIPRVYGGLGIAIMSTPQGVMTGREAWQRHLGGEVLCYVW
ncbi:MAG: 30S ribosomal protein S8 [Chloroflexi bacterium]|nr:30S ribosomal protein S8 [Chloroflexota bacterium]